MHDSPFALWHGSFFILMLLSIALVPLVNGSWWGRRYPLVTLAIAVPAGIIVLATDAARLGHVASEYLSFLVLLGSLFVIAGGIVIRTSSRGLPRTNALFMIAGAAVASLIGTTGASMVLIRPLIRANRWRRNVTHLYVFFIFLVSNIGGLLTPLGDPPLFLGYLRGVPFAWTLRLFPVWLLAIGILVTLFFLLDNHFLKMEDRDRMLDILDDLPQRPVELHGTKNILYLAMVVGSLFLPALVREGVMLAAAALSIYTTPVALREENAFTYHPIIEVAILFAGIFVTMAPVQGLLEARGSALGVTAPWQFFWASGILSSFLDNAPTYLVFMTTAQSLATAQGVTAQLVAGVPPLLLAAISSGSVLMGANSYIGNGPNFMVKAICEENGIAMPSFFGYMAWSVSVLIPLFLLITAVFYL